MRWRLVILVLAALVLPSLMLAACGDGEEGADGSISPPIGEGRLLWQQTTYAVAERLPPEALNAAALEALGEARTQAGMSTAFRWQASAKDWELITQEDDQWVVWEPQAVAEARHDLMRRLGVVEADLEVRQVERVSWPDACLGAPQHDEVCAQVVTEGFRIELAAGAKTYRYHADLESTVRAGP